MTRTGWNGWLAGLLAGVVGTLAAADVAPLAMMEKVADWQLANPSPKAIVGWEQGALYAGMMALGDLSPRPDYRRAMMDTGTRAGWAPGTRTYHADDHVVGQMYAEMYALYRDPHMLAPLRARFDRILRYPPSLPVDVIQKTENIPGGVMRWWWCDALFMGPPAWIRLASVTGDTRYLDFMAREWKATSDFLYDAEEGLYYRDKNFFTKREANGRKVFWARGNGWVIAGLARVLQVLPAGHPRRAFFETQFKQMAEKLRALQPAEGAWHASLLDTESYPIPEASGTGFNAYALAWGVNQGLLESARFEPAVRKAWRALCGFVAADGKLTQVQPVGAAPKIFDREHTDVYGVGAFLLAGGEMVRMDARRSLPHVDARVVNDADFHRPQATVEIAWADVRTRLPDATAENVAVMDGDAARWLTSQVLDEDDDGRPDKLLFQWDFWPKQHKTFTLFARTKPMTLPAPPLTTAARFVPERADDFAWENDRMAFRVYGPALWKMEKPGSVGSGVDVWCKHVRAPVMDRLYREGDYHIDKGLGVDAYKVGAGRGCGGTAIWAQNRLWSGRHFERWKCVAAGPVRAVFELSYGAWDAAGRDVAETKRVSLDLGSNFNRFESRFTCAAAGTLTAAAGVSVHPGGRVAQDEGWASVWEPADGKDNGHLGVAVILPGGSYRQVENQALLLKEVNAGEVLTFYAGAGWSKGPDAMDEAAWTRHVRRFVACTQSPLKVEWK